MPTTPPMRIKQLDHFVMRVSDREAMLAFYCGILGLTIAHEQPDLGLTHLRVGNAFIDLITVDGALGRQGGAAAGDQGRNLDHLCLQVEPFDPGQIHRHFSAHGIAVSEVVQRYGASGTGPSIYLKDPEGNGVELKGPPHPA
jgi:catechol 2,3-dioxygenase-like lactoylglutathione lyase family enzyme